MFKAWPYYALKMISFMVCLLPYSGVLYLGNKLGILYYHLAGRQRDLALRQMQESLGLTPLAAQPIIKSSFRKLGMTFFEVLYTPALTPRKLKEYVTIENRHYLEEARQQGHGVVVLSAHFGNWEWMGAAFAAENFPVASIVKPQPNDQLSRILNEYRHKTGVELFTRGTNEMVSAAKAIKKGLILALLADQDAGPQGLFIEFFGKPSSTPIGATIFAKRLKTPVVPIFIVRKPEGGHRIFCYEPLYYKDTGNEEDDIYQFTLKTTKIIEQMIRLYPDEWLWFQKRWNTSKS